LAFDGTQTGLSGVRSIKWRCPACALTWKVIQITLPGDLGGVTVVVGSGHRPSVTQRASLPFNALKFRRGCSVVYFVPELEIRNVDSTKALHPKFACRSALRIVETRVQSAASPSKDYKNLRGASAIHSSAVSRKLTTISSRRHRCGRKAGAMGAFSLAEVADNLRHSCHIQMELAEMKRAARSFVIAYNRSR